MSRPWMPFYVADYLADTLDLGTEEHGCYIMLLMLAWRRTDGALPNDLKYLQRALASCMSDMHGNRFNRVVPGLLKRFFTLGEDGNYRNDRLTKEREKSKTFSGKQKENVGKRWSKTKQNNGLPDTVVIPTTIQSQIHKEEERKQEPAVAAVVDLEKQFFDRAIEVIKGPPNDARKVAGMLRKACGNDIAKARSSLELSVGKSHPKSWIMGHINWLKKKSSEPSDNTVFMNDADDRYVIQ